MEATLADSAFKTMYRNEAIAGFEVMTSMLRQSTVTEANFSGNSAIFLVASSGDATYTTRGVNGLIPARADSLTQNTCTLTEKHDLVRKTGFNITNSQGDQRKIMQNTTLGTINRAIDNEILSALSATTTTISTAQTASHELVQRAQVKLGNNDVPIEEEDSMFAVVSPAFMGYLRQTPEFASRDYVTVQPLVGPARRVLRWAGFNWIVSSLISGLGTSAEYVYFYHRNAIGSAANKSGIDAIADYDEEQDYSWARASVYSGAKLLQTGGVVKVSHDGSALA
jgi:hypothetical protein